MRELEIVCKDCGGDIKVTVRTKDNSWGDMVYVYILECKECGRKTEWKR